MARASHAAAARVVTPLAAHASPRVRAMNREGQPALVPQDQQRFLAHLSRIN
jgi:hypothetical protein